MNNRLNHARFLYSLVTAGVALLAALEVTGVRPAMADSYGWNYQRNGTFFDTPGTRSGTQSGGYGPIAFDMKAGSGPNQIKAATFADQFQSTVVAVAFANTVAGTSASASIAASAMTINNVQWWDLTTDEASNSLPTTGLTFTSKSIIIGSSAAAASYATDPVTGAISYVGSASASGSASTAGFPEYPSPGQAIIAGDNSIGLPSYMQCDSNSSVKADPPGGAHYLVSVYDDWGHGASVSIASTSSHSRSGYYIYQGGSPVWGENMDLANIQVEATVTCPVSYFQAGGGIGGDPYAHTNGNPSASSSNGSGAAADFVLISQMTVTAN